MDEQEIFFSPPIQYQDQPERGIPTDPYCGADHFTNDLFLKCERTHSFFELIKIQPAPYLHRSVFHREYVI